MKTHSLLARFLNYNIEQVKEAKPRATLGEEGFGQKLDRPSKQLGKLLVLLGKFVMYLTHVFMQLWAVLGGLKERKLARKFIWKMIVFYQFSN